MSSTQNTGWLTHSLLQLSPPAFFHNIWTDFVRTNVSLSPHLIEGLYQAAEQLIINNDLENACQIWLICAFLESQRGNGKTALTLAEKTADLAQSHHLPKIHEWATWGASSLCARQGNLPEAIQYLNRLNQLLNKHGDWMLASVIYILERNLNELVTAKRSTSKHPDTEPQLHIILDQFLHWGLPNLTKDVSKPPSDDKKSFLWRFWQTIKGIFKGKNRSKSLGEPIEGTPSMPLSRQQFAELQLPSPTSQPQTSSMIILEDQHTRTNGIKQGQDQKSTPPQIRTKSELSPVVGTENQLDFESSNEPEYKVPSLTVYGLGSFRVYQNEEFIEQWASGKGKLIFKYLLIRRQQPVAKEVLMDQFWPDSNSDAARNNLNVAIYGLRQALRIGYEDFSHILFKDDHYLLNPELKIWIDFENFWELGQTARRQVELGNWEEAIQHYHAAVSLYQGDLFAEDRYEEWILPHRQHLQDAYLSLLEQVSQYYFQNEGYVNCIEACRNILEVDPCRESAHRRLMRCYCRQGQYYLGMRQYHHCEEALQNELDVSPSPETTKLYVQIRRNESI